MLNLLRAVFSVGETALGGWGANIFRVMTIALSVVYTMAVWQTKGQKAEDLVRV